MSIQTMMTDDVVILHPAFTTDNRGNQVKNWLTATAVTSKGWLTMISDNTGAGELNDHREGTNSVWVVFLPTTTQIDNLCRVTGKGKTFEVDGEPLMAHTPREDHHQEVRLKFVRG